MDFALLPPEVNSTLMYSGPGSGSMLTAATAWQSLAAELNSTANSYRSLISGLTAGPWLGPAAAAMSAAVAPHLTWLSNTAVLAEQAGAQAAAAAGAYEAAFAGTVPPVEVVANRTLLAELVATNILGQNTPAIAVVEADYAEMWAQDAGAMYSYAGSSAEATALTPFALPPQVTTPTGAASQAAAVAQASATSVAASVQDSYTNLNSSVNKALTNMSSFYQATPFFKDPLGVLGIGNATWNSNGDGIVLQGVLGDLAAGITGSSTLDASTGFNEYIRLVSPFRLTTTAMKDLDGLAHSFLPAASHAAEGAANAIAGAAPNLGGMGGLGGLGNALAGLGKSAQIGGLSVPNAWAADTGGLGRVATLPFSGAGANAALAPEASQHMLGGMPLTGGLGRMGPANAPRYGFHPTVMTRPPFAG